MGGGGGGPPPIDGGGGGGGGGGGLALLESRISLGKLGGNGGAAGMTRSVMRLLLDLNPSDADEKSILASSGKLPVETRYCSFFFSAHSFSNCKDNKHSRLRKLCNKIKDGKK